MTWWPTTIMTIMLLDLAVGGIIISGHFGCVVDQTSTSSLLPPHFIDIASKFFGDIVSFQLRILISTLLHLFKVFSTRSSSSMKRSWRGRSSRSDDSTISMRSPNSDPRSFQKSGSGRTYSRFWVMVLCLISSRASCLTFQSPWTNHVTKTNANKLRNGYHRRALWLHQTTTTLQETTTVTLQWTEFHGASESSETPVLLLHGLLGSKRNFASLAISLGNQLEKQRRIIGVDLRNHGDSDHAPEMTYTIMAQDVVEFMNSQGLEKVVLVGHSMGGKIAQAMSLLYPDRVDGLVVLDIAPVVYSSKDPHWKAVEDIMHAMQSVEDASTKSMLDKHLRSSIPDPNLRAFVLTNYDARLQGWKIPVATICHQLDSIAGFDVTDHKTQCYEGDVFIINGGQSRFVRHAYMDRIAELFPNHMLTTIRGAGHWVHAEAPDDTIALLKRYLDR